MEIPNWLPEIIISIFIIFATFVGGYAVLRKRVKDLENTKNKKLDKDEHEKLCTIATLEMKEHVSDAMTETLDDFESKVFKPAIDRIIKAVEG